MKSSLRLIGRLILKHLSRLTIRKHKPLIIGVLGEGPTSIAREFAYAVVSTTLPARRNLETPEAEFSLPLTILDYPNYPQSVVEWLWVMLKTFLQLFTIRPYKHALVLE